MSFKLICIDLDGTLLNNRKEISAATLECLRLASKQGVQIVITTGRKYIEARYYSDLIGLDAPLITSNGAFIKAKGSREPLGLFPLGSGPALSIHHLCYKYHVYHCFHTIQKEYSGNSYLQTIFQFTTQAYVRSPARAAVEKKSLYFQRQWRRLLAAEEEPFLKCVAFCASPTKMAKLRQELLDTQELEVVSSGLNNVEITRKGVSKASGVATLARYFGLRPNEIMAIGDNENDLAMIEYAGLGVAMGNATDLVKQKANEVTTTNEHDGVAQVIRKYL
jgi:Cof subfamily protein (haloacid dehalogenase superfamily)